VYNSFLCVAQHIAVKFFLCTTRKNENLGELISTALTACCPDFLGLEKQTKT